MYVSDKNMLKKDERKKIIDQIEDDFLYKRYSMLQWEYIGSFSISGLLFLYYSGHLCWILGIAWVLISNIIAIMLVRIDVTINVGRMLECEKRKIDSFMNLSSFN